ncbi:uncharacterized protein LOC126974663 isoform X2 [Leptidea sinapis]|uniref:uncharacterized protein LOC126974663 isoform X2 n=1 Tax=Leptidea sinapis TaxID=189913 RepID=UPI0021C4172F|nr:uncharacterized protein LOC126974663 isoform X2 [Leptidea sinapis]
MDINTKVVLNSPAVDDETDFRKKIEIAVAVNNFLEDNILSDPNNPVEILHKLTGQPRAVCNAINKANETALPKTFDDWLDEYNMRYMDEYQAINRESLIRNLVVHHYVHRQTVPTMKLMVDFLHTNGHKDITLDKLRQLLKANGFIWQRLPRTSKSILVEDPKQVFERQSYLSSILKYREQGRHIVYVNETVIRQGALKAHETSGTYLYCYAVVSPDQGLLDIKVTTVNIPSSSLFNKFPPITPWIIDEVIKKIPEGSVIVWPCRSYHAKSFEQLPDLFSTKNQMKDWLQFRNIPFDNKMHRAELIKIIESSKYTFEESQLDKLEVAIAAYGHVALRLPRKLGMLSLFEIFWTRFFKTNVIWHKKCKTVALVRKAFEKRPLSHWKEFNNKLIQKEITIFKEDRAMEEVIDKILTMARRWLTFRKQSPAPVPVSRTIRMKKSSNTENSPRE